MHKNKTAFLRFRVFNLFKINTALREFIRPTKGHLTFTSLLRKFMLWLFFLIPGNYVFLLFLGMVMYANELETKEK